MKRYYIHRIAATFCCIILSVFAFNSHAQNRIELYVGQKQIVCPPNPPGNAAIFQTAWGSHHPSVSVEQRGYNEAWIKVESYFTGTAEIQCDYYWYWYSGNVQHTKSATTYFQVTCKPVQCRLSETSLVLSVGEGKTIEYTLSPQITPTPTVRFLTNNSNVATVNQNGYVRASGPGRTTITVENSAGPDATCEIQVRDVDVRSASISDLRIEADKGASLRVDVSPSNATVKSTSWSVESGSDIVSISSSGYLSALKPGNATISCLVNGSVRSNTASVSVYEPTLTYKSSTPGDGATDVSAFVSPSLTFSHNIYKSASFDDIALSSSKGKVEGKASISGNALTFVPSKPLDESTKYTLTIPAGAVKNKWDTPYGSNISLRFTTGEYEKLKLELSPVDGSYITKDVTPITLKCDHKEATIRYTTDGSVPSHDNGKIYAAALTFSSDVTVKAIAMLEGYKDSEIVEANYFISALAMSSVYPDDENPPYVYEGINPHMLFDGVVLPYDNFRKITLSETASGTNVSGQAATWLNLLVFMPDEDLKPGTKYTMTIPRNAIVTSNDESNKEISWSFTTRNIAQSISVSGDYSGLVLDEESQLKSWGLSLNSFEPSTAYYSFDKISSPKLKASDVASMESGLMHSLYLTNGGSLKGYGRNFCNELARDFASATHSTINISDDVIAFSAGSQTTAFIKNDKSLYMLGRNDFGQIGDSTFVKASKPVKVLDDVSSVACGLGFTLAIKTDGSLWAWGRNDKGQLGDGSLIDRIVPTKVADGVSSIFVSSCGGKTVAALMTDGTLRMWGDNASGQLGTTDSSAKFSTTPIDIPLAGVTKVAIGEDYILFLNSDNELYAIGDNKRRQIPGISEAKLTAPTLVQKYVTDIAVGNQSTLVLSRDGSVSGCGKHAYSLMGDTESPSVYTQIFKGVPYAQLTGVKPCFSNVIISLESTLALPVYPVPVEADYQEIVWSVDNPSVVTVDEYGVIHPANLGKAELTVTMTDKWHNSFSAKIPIEVADHDGIGSIAVTECRKWNAYANGNVMTINNMAIGDTFLVYNMQGILIHRFEAETPQTTINLPGNGFYIVCSNNQSVKVINR